MHRLFVIALLGSIAAPALAQQPTRPAAPPPPPVETLPPEIVDGSMVDQLGNMVGALSKAFLNLPIGEVEAAVENRPATPADRGKTVRSVSGMDERQLDNQIEQSKGAMRAGGQAMARALPVLRDALNKAGEEIERATANIPQPGYPRR